MIYPLSNLSPDPHDGRDYRFTSGTSGLPAHVDLRNFCLPIENQLSTNSCTANAGTSICEILMARAGNAVNLSRLFLYFCERRNYPELANDGGAYMRDVCSTLHYYGVCTEDTWPFDVSKVNTQPTDESFAEARTRQANRYERIETTDIDLLKASLAKGYPVLIGQWVKNEFFSVPAGFESQLDYFIRTQYSTKPSIGSHAMFICGYTPSYFIVGNSWGLGWGDQGYWAMPYEFLNWTHDAWVVTKFAGVDLPDLWSPAPVVPEPVPPTPPVEPDPTPTPPEPQFDPLRLEAIRSYLKEAFRDAVQAAKDYNASNDEIEAAMGWRVPGTWWRLTGVFPVPTPGPYDAGRAEAIRTYLNTLLRAIRLDQIKYEVSDAEVDAAFNAAGFWAQVMATV